MIISNNDVLVPNGAIDTLVWWLDTGRFDVVGPLSTDLGAGIHARTQGLETLLRLGRDDTAFVTSHENYQQVHDRLQWMYGVGLPLSSKARRRALGRLFDMRQPPSLTSNSAGVMRQRLDNKAGMGLESMPHPAAISTEKHLNGFFFALGRSLQLAEHISGDLIDPALVNVNGENDLYARLDAMGGFSLGVPRDSFVFHYKGSTLGGCTEKWWNLWWALFGPRDCRDVVQNMVPRTQQ